MKMKHRIGTAKCCLGLAASGILLTLSTGCSGVRAVSVADGSLHQPAPPLVLPSTATLEVLGSNGLQSREARILNARKDVMLGADLPPAVAPVNLSQVYIRDQQWILNGRPWDNYLQTTRSLQLRSR